METTTNCVWLVYIFFYLNGNFTILPSLMQNSVHSLQAGAWSKPMPFLLKRFEKLFLYNAIVSFYQQVTHATQES